MEKHIYMIGFMGTGKSTVSKKLREKLCVEELDMDAEIVRKNRISINEMFEKYGEEYFRDKETQMIEEIALDLNLAYIFHSRYHMKTNHNM